MRKTVVLIECERCHREEKVDPEAKQESRKVVVQLGEAAPTILYQDLCTPCHNTILNCLTMMKETEKKSPIRLKKRMRKGELHTNGPVTGTAHVPHQTPPPQGPVRAPRG